MAEAIRYNTRLSLVDIIEAGNVAELLDSATLGRIGGDCKQGATDDDASEGMQEWRDAVAESMALARQWVEEKKRGTDTVSNVKLPMLRTASLQFSAQAYKALLPGDDIAKAWMPGIDDAGPEIQARAKRVTAWINYQLCNDMGDWEEGMDALLTTLPLVGCLHKLTHTGADGPESILVLPDELIVAQWAGSPEKARRMTYKFRLSPNELYERQADGRYLDVDVEKDDDGMHDMRSQHTFLDLDGDGYQEPYIVDYDDRSGRVLRVAPRFAFGEPVQMKGRIRYGDVDLLPDGRVAAIRPRVHFTRYGMFPPDNGKDYWWIGLGHMMGHLVAAANTIGNQLIDAGSISNGGGGLIDHRLEISGGAREIQRSPGRYESARSKNPSVPMQNLIYEWPVQEPSNVLFALFGAIKEMVDGIPAVVRFSSDAPANMSPMTMMGYIEAGQELFASIYKRLRRSMTKEIAKIAALNFVDADVIRDKYQRVLNMPADPAQDFFPDLDVIPTADPSLSSKMEQRAKANILLEIETALAAVGGTGMDRGAVVRRALEMADVDVKGLFPEPTPEEQEEAAKAAQKAKIIEDFMIEQAARKASAETSLLEADLAMKDEEIAKLNAEIDRLRSQTILDIAKANDVAVAG